MTVEYLLSAGLTAVRSGAEVGGSPLLPRLLPGLGERQTVSFCDG